MIYLAGPIDAVTKGEAADWRAHASRRLVAGKLPTYSPTHAFCVPLEGTKWAREITSINRCAIQRCAAMLANLEGPGFGTIREIEFAVSANKPVYVFGRDITNHAEAHDIIICNDLDQAIAAIIQDHVEVHIAGSKNRG